LAEPVKAEFSPAEHHRGVSHRIATLRAQNDRLEMRLQQREEVISTLADKVAALRAIETNAKRYRDQRDEGRRLFNRIEAAISHHRRDKSELFVDDIDERLYAARDRILRDSAEGNW
jgi:hypothetical protein